MAKAWPYRLKASSYFWPLSSGSRLSEFMDYLAFPLRIDSIGRMARSNGAEESLLRLLKIMLTTPARGWPGMQDFGVRDALAELPFKFGLRQETVKQINGCLRELGIDWVEVKMIEIDSSSDAYEPAYVFTLFYKGKGVERLQIK
jgi:hypothetical protein